MRNMTVKELMNLLQDLNPDMNFYEDVMEMNNNN